MHHIPSNSDNIIDSRDIIARLDELTAERDELASEQVDAVDADADEECYQDNLDAANTALEDWDEDNAHELAMLKELNDEGEGISDWKYGATLIAESYFTEYCQELVSDIGDLPKNIPRYIEIDWDKTADNLKQDYTSVTFDGADYYVR